MENTFGKPVEVEVRDSLEKAMKILKQKMSKEGILQELKRRGGGSGVAALCGGGGQGDALFVRTIA